jgi:predicted DNA-binding transcriptional regulator YafY
MSDDGPNYAELNPPDDKSPDEYTHVERRCEIYRLIEEAGHPHNLERSQRELGDRYGVSQRQISKDIDKLREFEAKHNKNRATSVTSWLSEKTVMQHLDAAQKAEEMGDFEKAAEMYQQAMDAQMDYTDFLFKLGQLDEAPTSIELEGDAEEAYMSMLKQAADTGDRIDRERAGGGAE